MESIRQDDGVDEQPHPVPIDEIAPLVDALARGLVRLLTLVRPVQAAKITATVGELAGILTRLLGLIVHQTLHQAEAVVMPLAARQHATDRRLETQAKEIVDLHLRIDTRAEQIDDQERRIAKLEAREAGGGE